MGAASPRPLAPVQDPTWTQSYGAAVQGHAHCHPQGYLTPRAGPGHCREVYEMLSSLEFHFIQSLVLQDSDLAQS